MRLLKTSTAELTDRRAQSCSSGPEIGSTSLPHFAQLPVSVQRALTAEMGLTWKLAPANPPCLGGDALEFGAAAGENLVGRSIICSWPNNVGWSVGKVLKTFTDTAGLQQTVGQTLKQPNFRVSYNDDGSDTWSQVLDKGNCLNIITSGGGRRARSCRTTGCSWRRESFTTYRQSVPLSSVQPRWPSVGGRQRRRGGPRYMGQRRDREKGRLRQRTRLRRRGARGARRCNRPWHKRRHPRRNTSNMARAGHAFESVDEVCGRRALVVESVKGA